MTLAGGAGPIDWESVRRQPLAPVTVAVLDSGIDATHPDLVGRVKGATVVEMVGGRAVTKPLPSDADNDLYEHGTAVAGIIAGIAPNAEIFDVRVLDAQGGGGARALFAGFEYALGQPWRLINISSAAEPTARRRLMDLCEAAYFRGRIVVAARRNLPLEDDGLPAELSACIGVDRGTYPSPFDYIFRPHTPIEFEARGEAIVVAHKGGGYTTRTGTSFATPTVTALCALLLGAYPEMTLFEIKAQLLRLAHRDDDRLSVR